MQVADLWCRKAVFHQWEPHPDELLLLDTVKISTSLLVSEWHVLTTAHCIYNSKDYMKGDKKVKVSFLNASAGCWQRDGDGEAGNALGSGAVLAGTCGLDLGPQLGQNGL